ncbi:MAG: hypothetical protein HOY71_46190, partial [Nonomuraea sp.]|nr:hypothetical protein [Nonomuraea sp.]
MSAVLVVPVRVDALCLAADRVVTGPSADFTRLPYRETDGLPYVSEVVLPVPFQDETLRLRAGVHLHWSLPDALTRLVQADGEMRAPAVPNRWLVTRMREGTVERQWVVESDHLSEPGADDPAVAYPAQGQPPFRRLGRKLPLSAWPAPAVATLDRLTAVGYGEPTFAAFYPDCHSVFGLHDPEAAGVPEPGVSYDVLGWYTDPADDPAAGLTPEELERDFRWSVPTGTGQAARTVCHARVDFAPSPLPANPLLDGETGVYVGTTATEALASHLGEVLPGVEPDQAENLLEAIAFADDVEGGPLDLGRKLAERRHAAAFRTVASGTLWTLRRQDGPAPTPEQRQARERLAVPEAVSDLLNLLNAAQSDVDAATWLQAGLRERLFTDWYRYLLCAYPPETVRESYPDPDEVAFYLRRQISRLGREGERAAELGRRLTAARADLDAALESLNG